MPASALYDAAAAVLATAAAALTTSPARAYVAVGAVAFDCDQLTVAAGPLEALRPGDRTLPQRVGPGADVATVRIERVRCVPVPDGMGAPPAASVIDAQARALYEDGYAIWRALAAAMSDPAWLGGSCRPAGLDRMEPVDPQGGVWGWSIVMRVVIDSEQWAP